MLKPFHMLDLEGQIEKIKEIRTIDGIERWYEDENGNRAIVFRKVKRDCNSFVVPVGIEEER